ncbi:MAG: selenium-dependent molybdenum cofactor biosynthesis protein YqeB [Oscillospiraceae bacterium]
MVVLIKGAGDIASGIALRLAHCKYKIVMTELSHPTTVRCTVAFSRAVYDKCAQVEDVNAVLVQDIDEARKIIEQGKIAVVIDKDAAVSKELKPDLIIDAILAKYNTGTKITDAKCVIGIGPGFIAGEDCHAAVETNRGHTLGRVIYKGSPIANTGEPGNIGGYTSERIIRAVCDGIFEPLCAIGDIVTQGQKVAIINGEAVYANIGGVVRGMLPKNTQVHKGMKSGDIDPRGIKDYCYTVSDKALAVGGGVLEAMLNIFVEEY